VCVAFAQRNDLLGFPEEAAREQSKTRLVRATPATEELKSTLEGVLSSRRRAESVARTAGSEARLVSDVSSRQTKTIGK